QHVHPCGSGDGYVQYAMNGVRAVSNSSTPLLRVVALLAFALACAGARAADAPADDRPRTATVPVPGSTQTVEIPAPVTTGSPPAVPLADSVPGGDKRERVQVSD